MNTAEDAVGGIVVEITTAAHEEVGAGEAAGAVAAARSISVRSNPTKKAACLKSVHQLKST